MSPWAARRPCPHAGCSALIARGEKRCPAHQGDLRVYDHARGTAAQRGFGWAWQQLAKQVKQRDGGLCQEPGCGAPGREVDHVVPRHRGGTDDMTNLRLLCTYHHRQKTGREAARVRNVQR